MNPFSPYPHKPNKKRFLVFVPVPPNENVSTIFDVVQDADLNCANCGQTLLTFEVGRGIRYKPGVLNEKERTLVCPNCASKAKSPV